MLSTEQSACNSRMLCNFMYYNYITEIYFKEAIHMEKYILSCCSTADLTKEHFEAIDVKYMFPL